MVLRDEDFDDLVVGINAVSGALQAGGYGDRILCAVFAWLDGTQPVYWIYNYKRGTFYPFVPAAGAQTARLRARAAPPGPDRQGAPGRARARALVPALGRPALGPLGSDRDEDRALARGVGLLAVGDDVHADGLLVARSRAAA